MATHFSVLAWRTPGMREPGGLPSKGSNRVRHDWSDLAAAQDTMMATINLRLSQGCKHFSVYTNPSMWYTILKNCKINSYGNQNKYRKSFWKISTPIYDKYSSKNESEKWKWLSRVQLLATPWTEAHQAPPSMGFSKQEYWSGGQCLLHIMVYYLFNVFLNSVC